MNDDETKKVTVLADVVRQRQWAKEVRGRILDPWTRSCPFKGCTVQSVLPCDVNAEQVDGGYETESWFAVFCQCGATSAPARTEREALDYWNGRI